MQWPKSTKKLEPGFEPGVFSLQVKCVTTAPHQHFPFDTVKIYILMCLFFTSSIKLFYRSLPSNSEKLEVASHLLSKAV